MTSRATSKVVRAVVATLLGGLLTGCTAPRAVAPAARVTTAGRPRPSEQRVVIRRSCDCFLQVVYFAEGTAQIPELQRPAIDANVACLDGCGVRQRIELQGHADAREAGPEALALDRAREVRRYLIARGLEEKRLLVRSHGQRLPVRPGDSEEAREHNRRVVFVILGTGD